MRNQIVIEYKDILSYLLGELETFEQKQFQGDNAAVIDTKKLLAEHREALQDLVPVWQDVISQYKTVLQNSGKMLPTIMIAYGKGE